MKFRGNPKKIKLFVNVLMFSKSLRKVAVLKILEQVFVLSVWRKELRIGRLTLRF